MKNKYFLYTIVLLLATMAMIIAVCAKENGISSHSSEEVASTAPHTQATIAASAELHTDASAAEISVPLIYTTPEGIPVYNSEDFFLSEGCIFDLHRINRKNRRNGTDDGFSAARILASFPTSAIRLRDAHSFYLVFDTENGTRTFLHYGLENGSIYPAMLPLIVGDVHQSSDFQGITNHSTIEDVIAVDPVAKLYKAWYGRILRENSVALANDGEEGFYCASIHYLEDGLLFIEYDILSEDRFEVCNVQYAKNYTAPAYLNSPLPHIEQYDYSVAPEDLPGSRNGQLTNAISVRQPYSTEMAQAFLQERIGGLHEIPVQETPANPDLTALQEHMDALYKCSEPLDTLPGGDTPGFNGRFREYIIENRLGGTIGLSGAQEGVLTYKEGAMVLGQRRTYFWGQDSCYYEGFNGNIETLSSGLFYCFPTRAIRLRKNQDAYLIYDLDTGYRLFFLVSACSNYFMQDGIPMAVKSPHCFKDFAGIQIGDPIEKVEAVDSSVTLQKRGMEHQWNITPKLGAGFKKQGYPLSTIIYLTDGILLIEYSVPEDDVLVVSNIIYNKDYELVNPRGRTVNYKLDDRDLPWYEGS